jgi:hypothetical protein
MGSGVWLFYVDDSWNGDHNLLAGIAVPVAGWNEALRGWLDYRKSLATSVGLPVAYELHASKFISGRGEPHEDSHQRINWDRDLRKTVYQRSLDVIAGLPSTHVFAVHRAGKLQRLELYRALLTQLTQWLAERDGLGIVIMDGEDNSYREVHRELRLADRRIIEDTWLQGSHNSQFVQAADIVVHAALQQVSRSENRRFMWDWYGERFGSIELVK